MGGCGRGSKSEYELCFLFEKLLPDMQDTKQLYYLITACKVCGQSVKDIAPTPRVLTLPNYKSVRIQGYLIANDIYTHT